MIVQVRDIFFIRTPGCFIKYLNNIQLHFSQGQTPYQLAQSEGKQSVVELFEVR